MKFAEFGRSVRFKKIESRKRTGSDTHLSELAELGGSGKRAAMAHSFLVSAQTIPGKFSKVGATCRCYGDTAVDISVARKRTLANFNSQKFLRRIKKRDCIGFASALYCEVSSFSTLFHQRTKLKGQNMVRGTQRRLLGFVCTLYN